jgi:hypothetical protein
MRAHASVVLSPGFAGIDVELPMADAFWDSYRGAISLVPWTAQLEVHDNLGSATLDVMLDTDAGLPVAWISWRTGGVLIQSSNGPRFGEDRLGLLLDWLDAHVRQQPVPGLPSNWRALLSRGEAPGESPIIGVPKGPANSPQCATAQANWMSGPWDDLRHNCYSYACGAKSGRRVPGESTGQPITSTSTVAQIHQACGRDGLTYLPALPNQCMLDGYYIAIVWRSSDLGGFHCYRLNRDGTWSHKDGSRFARNADDTSRPITDLTRAWFHYGDEFEFVGYFHCPSGHKVT